MTDLEFQEMVRADSQLIKWRNAVDLPRMRKIVHEHKQEMSREGDWLRINSLTEQIWEIDEQLFEASLRYEQCKTNLMSGAIIADSVKRLLKSKDKLSRERGHLFGKGLEAFGQKSKLDTIMITPDMVERANEYPIDSLLDARRGFALCIFHDDHHPSMSIKNNFAHCFACGKTADVIDVYRKIHGATFPEAVKALQ